MTAILICALALLFVAACKWFTYYCMVCGLLYYVAGKHNEVLSEAQVMLIRDVSIERILRGKIGWKQ